MAQTIDTIRRLIVHAEERGMADLARKWQQVATAEQEFIRVSSQVAAAGDKGATSMARAYGSVLNKIEPLRPELMRLTADMQKLTAAHEQFGTNAARRSQEYAALVQSTRSYREEAKRAADEQTALAAKARELKAAIDPLAHSQAILKKEQAEYNRMAELGLLSTAKNAKGFSELDMALTRAQRKFDTISRGFGGDKLANNLRLTSSELTNLGFQLNDIASGLAMGQSPFTILTQQGGQVYQILASQGGVVSGLKAAGQWLVGLLTPARLVGGALVGAAVEGLAAWNRFQGSQAEVTRALAGVGRQSGLTRDRINEIALASASAAEVSVAAAREIATELARTGKIGAESFDGIIRSAKNYAATTGQDIGAATKELASAFAEPSKGADLFIEKLGAMDAATRDQIGALERSGKRTEAQRILNDALASSVAKASTVTSAWAIAWDAVSRAVSNADEMLGRALSKSDTTVERLEARRRQIEEARELASMNQRDPRARMLPAGRADRLGGLERDQSMDLQQSWREAENRSMGALRAEADAASIRARTATREAFPEIEQLERLEAAARDLNKALADPGAVSNIEATREALASVEAQIHAIQAGADKGDIVGGRIGRITEEYALQVQALYAVTDAQKAAVAGEQAYRAAIEARRGPLVASVEAERARALILEQSRATSEQSIAASQRQLTLVQAEIAAVNMTAAARTAYIAGLREEIRLKDAGRDATSALSREEIELAKALARSNEELQGRSRARDLLQGQEDQIRLIEAETDSIGMNAEERAVLLARMRAETVARELSTRGLHDEAAAYIRNEEAIARASAQRDAAEARAERRQSARQDREEDSGEARNFLHPMGSRAARNRDGSPSNLNDEVTAALTGSQGYSLGRSPAGTERVISYTMGGSGWGDRPEPRFRETADHLAMRLREAAEAAEEIKHNVEDAARERFDRDISMYGDLLRRQIETLQERRSRIADNDNSGSRGTPYLDPYSFKNPTRFYNPGPGGHFFENEGRTERAISAASNAEIAAIDAQISQLEAQASQLDRLAMLSSAGVDLTAQELAELQSINAAIRAGAGARDLSDFDRMMEAQNRRAAEELRATVDAINAGVTQRPAGANAGPFGMTSGGGASTASGALAAAGLSAYDTRPATGSRMVRGYAKGGELTVPGPSTGTDRPWILGLDGGEHVKVTPANQNAQVIPRARAIVQNNTFNMIGKRDEIRRSAGEALREARRQGRKVAGR